MVRDDESTTHAPGQWLELLDRAQEGGRRLLIVGSGDTGKTTLARWLVGQLAQIEPTARVDADVGQSQIGPPATVGWRLHGSKQCHCYFVGDVSPASRPATALSGLLRAVHDAEHAGAQYTVIDTTGYVDGHGAVALKSAKVELLAPVDVLVLGDDKPIRRLLKCWQNFALAQVVRLQTADSVRVKSVEARREHRRQRFAEALAEANMRWVTVSDKALVGTGKVLSQPLPEGLLLGFVDEMRRVVCLGLLQALDLKNRRLLVYSPAAAETAAGILFGAMALSIAGEQLDSKLP